MASMRLDFLGTGAAGGIPLWGCLCAACSAARDQPQRRRRPCSAALTHAGRTFLIDAGLGDLDQRYPDGVDAFLLTHFHPDHVQGLFHLRWGPRNPLPVYGPADDMGCADLFNHPGCLSFSVPAIGEFLDLGLGLRAMPIPLAHSKPTVGWILDDGQKRWAYCTDTRGLPPLTMAALQAAPLDALILDCSYPPGHAPAHGHNDVAIALQLIAESGAKQGILTHIGHDCQCWLDVTSTLPTDVCVANDGMILPPATAL